MKHIAMEFTRGATKIVIYDDKCVSEEEAEEILKDMARKIKPLLESVYRKRISDGRKDKPSEQHETP